MGKQDVAILIADCREAADEIERERKAHLELAESYYDATEEIERLEAALEMQKQASRDVAATYNEQEAEIERLRAALEEIAHMPSGTKAIAAAIRALKDKQ
jgi:chromosome segregation ATPase